MKKLALAAAALLATAPMARADKGMWLLNELKKENIERMKQLGFTLDPTALFDNNAPSIANAVVIFGRGCTGITTSNEGLIFTNHHCGYDAIQSQSSVEHDYLRDGFVAKAKGEELPIPGLSVRYLRSIEDVTPQIEAAAKSAKNEMERFHLISAAIDKIVKAYESDRHVAADIYPFYENNVFYLITYDVFTDVRLVFAPPSSMGKFGGDTDNWMWPRHTNDFSVFRAYAGADNKPADFSKNNKPYTPKYFAKVSMKGVKAHDYAMTIGFPGSTDRYLSSWGVQNRMKNENDPRILMRGAKQEVWLKHMKEDQATQIKYASKYAQSANYWKNSIGMNKGLKRLNVVAEKEKIEQEFAAWVAKGNKARKQRYGAVLDSLRIPAQEQAKYLYDNVILSEALSGMELRTLVANSKATLETYRADARFKDYSPVVAKATMPVMLRLTREKVAPEHLPSIYTLIDEKFGGDYNRYTEYLFANSIFVEKERITRALSNAEGYAAAWESDPAIVLLNSWCNALNKVNTVINLTQGNLYKGRRLFFAGLREMWPNRALPSDANFTMRMSYGSVSGYKPYDGGMYDYFTTQQGILEKQDPDSHEFAVQPEILKLIADRNFGQYADADGELHLCFLSDNDITGGNSGSPVFDKNGDLIGLAFDGNWEAMSGDIEFEPNLQRTISVDIRFVLWMIDKWGGAQNLIDELRLVR